MNVDAIVLGLGNPGTRYKFTRHNVGFMALDLISQGLGFSFSSTGLGKKIKAEVATAELGGKRVLFVKPQTFMNLSGESVAKLYQEHNHLRDAELIVCHDEVDIDFGKLRVKKGGGDAGHNGLKSIRKEIGSGEFYRIRMGVGRPPADWEITLADYVLTPFRKDEDALLTDMLIHTENTVEALLKQGLEAALRVSSS